MKTNIFLVACLGLSLSAYAGERQFSYAQNDAKVQYFGNSKAETYDVAVRISDPALAGKQITAVTVRLCEDATISNPQGWISSALLLEKKKNAPDIALVEASVSEDNVLTAVFTEPYTLTDAGVYVGYSITIAKASTFGDQNPNPVSASSTPDGMYIHSTRTDLKWTSLAEHGVASTMEVTLSGDFASPAVSVTEVGDVRTDGMTPTVKVPVTLCNYGDEAVASLEYTCRFGDGEAQTSEVAAEIPAGFGVWQTLELDVPTYGATAPLTISVSRVNGKENTMAGASATGSYVLMAFVPQMRPLMEEYTGLWCGFCPRGFVAMEEMNRLHPDDFVCVSYHSNGGGDPYSGGEPLQYIAEFPNEVDGFPLAFFNREMELDPYFGSGSKPMGILDNWQKLRQAECPADISVELSWADDRHDRLVCRSTTKFVEDADGTAYRVNYIITGDGFKTRYVYTDNGKVDVKASLLLLQSNYFAGEECDYDSEFWTPFIEGGKKIDNLVFNDVAMALSPVAGEEAFDGALAANTEYTHEYEFDYAKIVNLEPLAADGSGGPANVLPDDGSLRCIAVLLTADGKFVNCNKSKLLQAASVSEVTRDAAAAVSGSEWFDLQGRRVDRPGKGAYIRVDRLADGSVRRIKTIKR